MITGVTLTSVGGAGGAAGGAEVGLVVGAGSAGYVPSVLLSSGVVGTVTATHA
jgi:hypothetical protein